MKLTKQQERIIKLMMEGWHFGHSTFYSPNSNWLQKNQLGHGGDTIQVHANLFNSLVKKKLITGEYSFPTTEYKLNVCELLKYDLSNTQSISEKNNI